jgi:hypothetical protein
MSYKMSIADKSWVIFVVFLSHPFLLSSVHFVLNPLIPSVSRVERPLEMWNLVRRLVLVGKTER